MLRNASEIESVMKELDDVIENSHTKKVNWSEIEKKLKFVISADPKNSKAHFYAALFVNNKNISDKVFNAKKELKIAADLGHDKAKLQFAIYSLESKDKKELNKAIDILQELAQENNKKEIANEIKKSAKYHLALVYTRVNQHWDDGIKLYENLVKDFKESKQDPDLVDIQTHLNIGKIYAKEAENNPTYYDLAEEVFSQIENHNITAEYLKNDLKFKKMLREKEQVTRESLIAQWLAKHNQLAKKNCYQAKLDLAIMYLKMYGPNPYFNGERDLVLAEKYLLEIAELDPLGQVSFLLYQLNTLKGLTTIADIYLKESAENGFPEAQVAYGEKLVLQNNLSGADWIKLAAKQLYHGAYFWKFKYYNQAYEINPQKKLMDQMQENLEKAAALGSVEGQLIGARCALEHRYNNDEDYDVRVKRAESYLEAILANNDYIRNFSLEKQKKVAKEWLDLCKTAKEKKLIVRINDAGKGVVCEEKPLADKEEKQIQTISNDKNLNDKISSQNENTNQNIANKTDNKENENKNYKRKLKNKKKPIITPPVNRQKHISVKIPLDISDPDSFITFIEKLIAKQTHYKSQDVLESLTTFKIFDKDKFEIVAPFDIKFYENIVTQFFMQGSASKTFSILLENGLFHHLFPFINFSDPNSEKWLKNNFSNTDTTFQQKRNLSITYIYGYVLAAAEDVSNYKALINCTPTLVQKELNEKMSILIHFIRTRYPYINLNPYLPLPELLPKPPYKLQTSLANSESSLFSEKITPQKKSDASVNENINNFGKNNR